ncbi:MAG TPA: SIS domain-containing protein [Chloroflexota bacterium]
MYSELPFDSRTAHPYHMYDEIKGQPDSVRRSLERVEEQGSKITCLLAQARRIFLIGSGTSLHAAEIGAWFLRSFSQGRMETISLQSYEMALYFPGLRPDDVVVLVSHSGTSAMGIRALERAHRSGAETVLLTGFTDSPAAGVARHVLQTGFDRESSWAHTASYTAALTTIAALANNLAAPEEHLDLSPLPDVIGDVLGLEELVHRLAAGAIVVGREAGEAPMFIVGAGPNAPTAREVQLKILETSYLRPLASELEQVLHGPLAAVSSDALFVLVAPPGPSTERAAALAQSLVRLEVTPVVLCGDGNVEAFGESHRLVIPDVPEIISPIPAIVPLQLFAYFLAVGRGLNPDLIHRDDERQRAARAQYE